MDEANPELESFRRQWRAEVSARSMPEDSNSLRKQAALSGFVKEKDPQKKRGDEKGEDLITGSGPIYRTAGLSIENEDIEGYGKKDGSREPRSALEHYEEAVEKESQGSLGDSLHLYRKAFKMDNEVGLKYKSKHFPPSYFTSKSNTNTSNASLTVPSTAHHSLDGLPQTINHIIARFEGLAILPAPPEIEGMLSPPCPISTLPQEILAQVLTELAIMDVASFVRLARVCKHLAYVVFTEEQTWKRVCVGSEVGFGAMHYQWQGSIPGVPPNEDSIERTLKKLEVADKISPFVPDKGTPSEVILHQAYSSSWQKMFYLRPRIRFNGCYISTQNYIRPGMASPSQMTWNSPIHVVTYYRYLRFFRDGTIITLQTSAEPIDVVSYLTKDLLHTHRNGQSAHLPSATMKNAFKGRWRLSTADDNPDVALKDAEGDVFIETEGVERYIYRMELSLRSAGKAASNNKLVWKGYWNYNRMADDWAQFSLKNEKAFFWSRVKSYGVGA